MICVFYDAGMEQETGQHNHQEEAVEMEQEMRQENHQEESVCMHALYML